MAIAVASRGGQWRDVLPVALALSTILCLMGWPEARIGLVANAVIAMLLMAGLRGGVFGPSPWSAQ